MSSRARLRSAGAAMSSAMSSAMNRRVYGLRNRLASLVWLLAVVCALVLALGALLVSLGANPDNAVVELAIDSARRLDGPFADVFTFDGENARTKARLVNWGLAALAYLIAGRVLDRLLRA
jgi:hypothetical protein